MLEYYHASQNFLSIADEKAWTEEAYKNHHYWSKYENMEPDMAQMKYGSKMLVEDIIRMKDWTYEDKDGNVIPMGDWGEAGVQKALTHNSVNKNLQVAFKAYDEGMKATEEQEEIEKNNPYAKHSDTWLGFRRWREDHSYDLQRSGILRKVYDKDKTGDLSEEMIMGTRTGSSLGVGAEPQLNTDNVPYIIENLATDIVAHYQLARDKSRSIWGNYKNLYLELDKKLAEIEKGNLYETNVETRKRLARVIANHFLDENESEADATHKTKGASRLAAVKLGGNEGYKGTATLERDYFLSEIRMFDRLQDPNGNNQRKNYGRIGPELDPLKTLARDIQLLEPQPWLGKILKENKGSLTSPEREIMDLVQDINMGYVVYQQSELSNRFGTSIPYNIETESKGFLNNPVNDEILNRINYLMETGAFSRHKNYQGTWDEFFEISPPNDLIELAKITNNPNNPDKAEQDMNILLKALDSFKYYPDAESN